MTTTIVETSTLQEVFTANPAVPTIIDFQTWTALPLQTGLTVNTQIGLFGVDLSKFNSDCALATGIDATTGIGPTIEEELATPHCKVENFSDYDGFAIAVYF